MVAFRSRNQGFILFLLLIGTFLTNSSIAQCTSCNSTNATPAGTQTIASGQKWCYTSSNSPAYSTALTLNGRIDVCSGATLDIFGSVSINTGTVYLYNCSKLKVFGAFTDYGVTKITAYCSQCGTPAYVPLSVNGSQVSSVNCNVTLPIDLIHFTAQLKENTVQLEWATAAEINNDYFTIEKSLDGELWETAVIIDGAGNSSETKSYVTYDTYNNSSIVYYRLKQTDFNGDFSYSQIAIIEKTKMFKFSVQPNPSNGEVTINIPAKEKAQLFINDLTGKTIGVIELEKKSGFQASNSINLQDMAEGVYTIVGITESGSKFSEKLVVVN